MATNMTYKERLLLVKTALKLLNINSRILPQLFSLHGTVIEIYIEILTRENRAYYDFQRLPWAVSTAQHGFFRMLTSIVWNHLLFVKCWLREIHCSGTSEDYFLPIANLKVIFYIFFITYAYHFSKGLIWHLFKLNK